MTCWRGFVRQIELRGHHIELGEAQLGKHPGVESDAGERASLRLFRVLAAGRPHVAVVSLELKRGARDNDMTGFRYDVIRSSVGARQPGLN